MANLGVGEVGDYIPGQGYVSYRKSKPSEPASPAPSPPATLAAAPSDAIQSVLTKIFGTVPRNKLKEAGLE